MSARLVHILSLFLLFMSDSNGAIPGPGDVFAPPRQYLINTCEGIRQQAVSIRAVIAWFLYLYVLCKLARRYGEQAERLLEVATSATSLSTDNVDFVAAQSHS